MNSKAGLLYSCLRCNVRKVLIRSYMQSLLNLWSFDCCDLAFLWLSCFFIIHFICVPVSWFWLISSIHSIATIYFVIIIGKEAALATECINNKVFRTGINWSFCLSCLTVGHSCCTFTSFLSDLVLYLMFCLIIGSVSWSRVQTLI